MSETRFSHLVRSSVTGVLCGGLMLVLSASFASLLFAGEPTWHLQHGFRLLAFTSIAVALVFTAFGGVQPLIAVIDEDAVPILALLIAAVGASLPPIADPGAAWATTLAALLITGVSVGLTLFATGVSRLGNLVQYIPQSVFAGYLAGLGWLLVVGAADVGQLSVWTGDDFGAAMAVALPACLLSVVLLYGRFRVTPRSYFPAVIIASVPLWFLGAHLADIGVAEAGRRGYLMFDSAGPPASQSLLPVMAVDWSQVHWPAIWQNYDSLAVICLISILSLVMAVNGISVTNRQDFSMNRELCVAGFANIVSGLGGGASGLPSVSLSALATEAGHRGDRAVGIVASVTCIVVYLFCLEFIGFTPRAVLAGLLLYLGIGLVYEWLIAARNRFSRLEFLVVPVIFIVTAVIGFLPGFLVGMLCAVLIFVVKYSSISAIRYVATARDMHSTVDRRDADQDVLNEYGGSVLIFALEGYLFFGSSGAVYQAIESRFRREGGGETHFLIIDFASVTGIDSSAALNFERIADRAADRSVTLCICGARDGIRAQLGLDRRPAGDDLFLRTFTDLDHALEYCEEELLALKTTPARSRSCFDSLSAYLSTREIERLFEFLDRRDVDAGETLTEQGMISSEMYFLESCSASAYLRTPTGRVRRVRRSSRGTIFGELGFFLEAPRTASVVVDEPGLVYVLRREQLDRMEREAPEVAAGLNRYLAQLLSERLMLTTRTLRAVSS